LDNIIKKFKGKPGGLIPVLEEAQVALAAPIRTLDKFRVPIRLAENVGGVMGLAQFGEIGGTPRAVELHASALVHQRQAPGDPVRRMAGPLR